MTKHAVQSSPPPTDPLERERWLDAIIPLEEAAALRGDCTPEALIRGHRKGTVKLIRRTTRLWGMRRREALAMPAEASPSAQTDTALSAPRTAAHAREVIQGLIDRGFLRRVSDSLLVEAEQLSLRPAELRPE
jgi:hypothetical protein